MTAPRITSSSVDRRRFLKYLWWGAGSAMAMALVPGDTLKASPRFARNPFTLGVASGDPTASGIVLWTRLAPEPADPTSLGQASIPVGWRVARDDTMRRVVAKGKASAKPELAHSVHAEVKGLRPGADYFYQFDAGGEESTVGHFRTAPAHHEWARQLSFGVATCQDFPSGYYMAYRDMVQNDLDLVLHLGDYTYEYFIDPAFSNRPIAAPFTEETVDLRTYRLRHTLYKLDPDLQAAACGSSPSSWCGTTTRWRTTTGAGTGAGVAVAGARPAPAATTKRCNQHLPIRLRARPTRLTSCGSTAGWMMAASPSSRCSTTASTAPTTRAATASRCVARPRRATTTRCSVAGRRTVGGRRVRRFPRALEHRRPAAVARRARAPPLRGRALLE